MECIILIGLPGSGKTSFVRDRFVATHDHVSKDLLRNNKRPQRRQEQLIDESLRAGRSLVVDNTNVSAAERALIIAAARRAGADVVGYHFPTEAKDALRRNRGRQGRDRVPDVAIFTTRKRLDVPAYGEGFDRLFVVVLDEADREFIVTPVSR